MSSGCPVVLSRVNTHLVILPRLALLCCIVCKSLEWLPSICSLLFEMLFSKLNIELQSLLVLFFSTWQRWVDFIFLLACVS